jgi:hypothetical protein
VAFLALTIGGEMGCERRYAHFRAQVAYHVRQVVSFR